MLKNKNYRKKNATKVYLQYPWRFPDSPYYKYLVENPPKGIKFINAEKQKGVITKKSKFIFSNKLKRIIRGTLNLLNLSIPNAHLSPKGDYDLIHCAHCLSKNKDRPWVADFEGVWQFWVGRKNKISKNTIRKILLRENCKKIMPWTERTASDIVKEFPEIKKKVEVVYPAVPLPRVKRKRHDGINLLFVARYFYDKGGLHALEAMNQLTEKYDDVRGIVVSIVPGEIKLKYSKNRKILFYDLMPQKNLFEKVFSIGNIFIYPGYSDSFGFAIIEAMGFGMPIVTVEGFARNEIVENRKTGFIIKKNKKIEPTKINKKEQKIIQKLVENCSILIEDKKLREKMSRNCINEIKNGKFSIKRRNEKLKKIYEEALK